jgi:hypothetical protein
LVLLPPYVVAATVLIFIIWSVLFTWSAIPVLFQLPRPRYPFFPERPIVVSQRFIQFCLLRLWLRLPSQLGTVQADNLWDWDIFWSNYFVTAARSVEVAVEVRVSKSHVLSCYVIVVTVIVGGASCL